MRNFRNYRVWSHGIDLADCVYRMSQRLPIEENYALKAQMRRAVVSIPSNFAEGCGRDSPKEFRRFIEISMGSSYELETQMIIADRQYHLSNESDYQSVHALLHQVQAELNALRNTLK